MYHSNEYLAIVNDIEFLSSKPKRKDIKDKMFAVSGNMTYEDNPVIVLIKIMKDIILSL